MRTDINHLSPTQDSYYIANKALQQKIIYLAINNSTAQRIYTELSVFIPHLTIALFPSLGLLPYEQLTPDITIVQQRGKILWQLLQQKLDILIVDVFTLQKRLMPKEFLSKASIIFQLEQQLEIESLRNNLIASGYLQVKQLTMGGEFVIESNKISISLNNTDNLLKLELMESVIKQINYSNSAKLTTIDKFILVPRNEYPSDNDSLVHFIKNYQSKFKCSLSPEIIIDLQNSILRAGIDFYSPLFFTKLDNLFDYCQDDYLLIYPEEFYLEADNNWQDINHKYQYKSKMYDTLAPTELYIPKEELYAKLAQFTTFRILINETKLTFSPLPQLGSIQQLQQFMHDFTGLIIISVSSRGRQEILNNSLKQQGIVVIILQSWQDIILTKAINKIFIVIAKLSCGFIDQQKSIALITENELYQSSQLVQQLFRAQSKSNKPDLLIRDLAEIKIGDLVVHLNHGVAQYLGLTICEVGAKQYEMVELEYQNKAKLYVPVNNLHLITRYTQLEQSMDKLDKLGGNAWDKLRIKAITKIHDTAIELLQLYAQRELSSGIKFKLPQNYNSFVHSFGYTPTVDQEHAFNDVIHDMQQANPMDRLICGDVGFGKTEVALRAAFICVSNGFQVAVLVPTTLLSEQHYNSFVNRFAGLNFKIAEISRFKTKKEINTTLAMIAQGEIDILIGTHRLIQADIKFVNLGLIIIDEEHRFGVRQKEQLKKIKTNADILSMTATPIPRTLSLSLEGVRDFSLIATPPSSRLKVKTIVSYDDEIIIIDAINREIHRGGQIFFLYNDVATIDQMHQRLQKLITKLRIGVAHGQMPELLLEHTIKDFIRQKYNLLLCSTIIESGIDIPNANTIIIYRADKLGLAQLHQLRGRVGRSYHQGYCYLLISDQSTKNALSRVEAINATSELGSGFSLATHDLELRGAGEILGDSQSGNIKHLGISLYNEILAKTIKTLKAGGQLTDLNLAYTEINLNLNTIIPADYCPDIHERLIYYKRLAKTETEIEIDLVYQDMIDNLGLATETIKNLINTHYLRVKAADLGIKKIEVIPTQIICNFNPQPKITPHKLLTVLQNFNNCRYDQQQKLIWTVNSIDAATKINNVQILLRAFS